MMSVTLVIGSGFVVAQVRRLGSDGSRPDSSLTRAIIRLGGTFRATHPEACSEFPVYRSCVTSQRRFAPPTTFTERTTRKLKTRNTPDGSSKLPRTSQSRATFSSAWRLPKPRAAVAQSTTGQRPARPVREKDKMTHPNSFGSRSTLEVGGRQYTIFRLDSLDPLSGGKAASLPFSLKILLENLLRNEDGKFVKTDDVAALASWDVKGKVEKEIAFRTARVLLQDFTGVPAVVDLAAMRDALARLGGDATEDQSASAGRPRHRPLGAGRRVRIRRSVPDQRQSRVRPQPGALRVPSLGTEGASTTSASFRRTRESFTRSTSSISRRPCS